MDELADEVKNIKIAVSGIYSIFENIVRKIGEGSADASPIIFENESLDKHGLFKFFKINGRYYLKPLQDVNISDGKNMSLSDFIGIDWVIKDVFRNTMRFASGKPANNVLLWGDRGTGKSSLIRAIARSFGEEPYLSRIKFIEVVEDTAELIYELISIARTKPYRFVLFFDDIAFDADSLFYKKLKSVLDGGLDELPENIVVYATSNKRHLTTERFFDSAEKSSLIHPEEEAEEGLSLSDRFGLSFGLYSFDKEVYLKIVDLYLKKYEVKVSSLDMEDLRKEALNYAVIKGSRSGRTARQFVVGLIKD